MTAGLANERFKRVFDYRVGHTPFLKELLVSTFRDFFQFLVLGEGFSIRVQSLSGMPGASTLAPRRTLERSRSTWEHEKEYLWAQAWIFIDSGRILDRILRAVGQS